jgi:hypothetical protein
MLIFVICFIYGCILNNQKLNNNKSVKTLLYFKDNIITNNTGKDERYINFVKEEDCSLEKIKELFDKKKILNILQSNDVSIFTKLSLLKLSEEEVKPFNIFSGGLLNDFKFDI